MPKVDCSINNEPTEPNERNKNVEKKKKMEWKKIYYVLNAAHTHVSHPNEKENKRQNKAKSNKKKWLLLEEYEVWLYEVRGNGVHCEIEISMENHENVLRLLD